MRYATSEDAVRFNFVVVAVTAILAFGCGGRPVPDLPDVPEGVVVFSLDGADLHRRHREASLKAAETDSPHLPTTAIEKPPGEESYGLRVLGKVEVADEDRRRKVVAVLREAIKAGPTQASRCFTPRHAIRVTSNGATIDVLICFHCDRYRTYRNGEQELPTTERTISSAHQPFFDALLTEAGIPLGPKE